MTGLDILKIAAIFIILLGVGALEDPVQDQFVAAQLAMKD